MNFKLTTTIMVLAILLVSLVFVTASVVDYASVPSDQTVNFYLNVLNTKLLGIESVLQDDTVDSTGGDSIGVSADGWTTPKGANYSYKAEGNSTVEIQNIGGSKYLKATWINPADDICIRLNDNVAIPGSPLKHYMYCLEFDPSPWHYSLTDYRFGVFFVGDSTSSYKIRLDCKQGDGDSISSAWLTNDDWENCDLSVGFNKVDNILEIYSLYAGEKSLTFALKLKGGQLLPN